MGLFCHKCHVMADKIGGFLNTDRAVNDKIVVTSVAPGLAANLLVVGGTCLVGMANILSCGFVVVAVNLHDSTDTVLLGSIDEDVKHVVSVTENVVGRTANDNTATLMGNLLNNSILCRNGKSHYLGAEVEAVKHSGRIIVNVGDELTIKAAFLRGKGGHLLVVEGNAKLLCHDTSDFLTR